MFDIMDTVNGWLQQGRTIALATVVETWGSAPRGMGSKMAIADDMAIVGSVSGGCIEGAVIEQAMESLEDKRPRLLHFGVSDDSAWDVGLSCGGKITVYVEPLDSAWWRKVTDYVCQDRPATTITVLAGGLAGQKMLIDQRAEVVYTTADLTADQRSTFAQINVPKSTRQQIDHEDVLVDVHRARPHLIIIGGAHVAMALQVFAKQLGFRVSLVDPRGAFATQERFPHVNAILHSYPDKALPQLGLDKDTYITILTHDPKIDDPALRTALPTPVPYIGVLSSKRTHEKRIKRLIEAGVEASLIERIRTPIGIDIDAQTPEEIALCIMVEIVAVRNGVRA